MYKLSPVDQVAILRYNRGYTRTIVPFTGSKEELLDGLAGWRRCRRRAELVAAGPAGLPDGPVVALRLVAHEHHPELRPAGQVREKAALGDIGARSRSRGALREATMI